ncbi:hypothetical protein E2K80_03935 [Rhodophyticola sp. CCM32]|uniref:hypothetical protein n=1 Tax=Rhodophyticola sp. CCM32 TaxID=2916397 RepID=UPI00107FCF56|nr:hypothetical protein [Rhodophyticola sp. CCM32]QBX99990.1 hypothetical protein E2K80_03935 [Rhodophyticola sp. CCM32]
MKTPRQDLSQCCGLPKAGRRTERVADLDRFEADILSVARCFFQTFASPERQTWVQAFGMAQTLFPGLDGANLAIGVLNVVQAMRVSRSSVFTFSNPYCADCARILSDGERQLTSALYAVRLGHRSTAHIHALILTEGGETERLIYALEKLAALADISADHSPQPPECGNEN